MVEAAVIANAPQFRGLDPWLPNIEVIECIVDGRFVDLHNECTLEGMLITCTPEVELRLYFVEDASQARFELIFAQVQRLTFSQDDRATTPLWQPTEVETFIGVEYTLAEEQLPNFTLTTIVGEFSFACRVVELRPGGARGRGEARSDGALG